MLNNPKLRYHEIQRNALLGRLRSLMSKLENPELTREQLDEIKVEVQECQAKLQELGFSPQKE